MNGSVVLKRAAAFAKSVHEGDASDHDWFHIERVVRTARHLASAEGADPFVCELAALLHDVAEERHRFMEHYLELFYQEWNGGR